jgi:hypothetical protein
VATFVLELYLARTEAAAVELGAERARLAAAQVTREGRPVRFLQSIFVPEDETCFLLYEAGSAGDVRVAAQRAGLPAARVAEARTGIGEDAEDWIPKIHPVEMKGRPG